MIEVEPAAEVASGEMDEARVERAAEAIHTDGYVVLHDAVDADHVTHVWERMNADAEELFENEPDHDLINVSGPDESPFEAFGSDRRGRQYPPFEPEYLYGDIIQNRMAAQVLEEVLGGQVTVGTYHSNVSLPGCGEQPLHVDMAARESEDAERWNGPCSAVVMNVPLHEFTVENGATEVWPGTQRVPCEVGQRHPTAEQRAERIEASYPPERAVMPRGSVLLRDIRLWHRGPGNYTTDYRPMLAQICSGGFDPETDDRDDIAEVGPFPPGARSVFEDGPLVYNVEYEE